MRKHDRRREANHYPAKGQVLVFKHAIATIEPVDEPKKDFTL
jgi:hypothetical protein